MFKHHNYIAFILSLIYIIILQAFSSFQADLKLALSVFVIFIALATFYNKQYLKYLQKYNIWILVKVALLFMSGAGLFALLPTSFARVLFLLSACAVVTIVEMTLGNFSENLLINEILVIACGLFISFSALNQYFPYFHNFSIYLGKWHILDWQFSMQPFYLIVLFLAVLLLSRAFYEYIPQGNKTKWAAAVSLGLFSVELYWALSLLPFHYSAQSLILFAVYYFCLILNYYYLFNTLTLKKIQFHLALILIACGVVVLATPWKILS